MRVAVPGNLNLDDEQDQLPETATRADQDQLPETAMRADTTHQSSCGVNRRSDESDKKGEVHCKVDASAAKAVVRVGSKSLYNARATDALATERLRARTSGEGSCERQRQLRTTTTWDDAKSAAPAAEASERNHARDRQRRPRMTTTRDDAKPNALATEASERNRVTTTPWDDAKYASLAAEASAGNRVTPRNKNHTRPAKRQRRASSILRTSGPRTGQKTVSFAPIPKSTQRNQSQERSFNADDADCIGKSLPAHELLPTNIASIFGPPLDRPDDDAFTPPRLAAYLHHTGREVQMSGASASSIPI